ncbi:hypothetical protein DMUE_1398 [Dictyocoela muelleri]|nr:hypothetical protein DMUE_1398 [Dictyocoela muelleri]
MEIVEYRINFKDAELFCFGLAEISKYRRDGKEILIFLRRTHENRVYMIFFNLINIIYNLLLCVLLKNISIYLPSLLYFEISARPKQKSSKDATKTRIAENLDLVSNLPSRSSSIKFSPINKLSIKNIEI